MSSKPDITQYTSQSADIWNTDSKPVTPIHIHVNHVLEFIYLFPQSNESLVETYRCLSSSKYGSTKQDFVSPCHSNILDWDAVSSSEEEEKMTPTFKMCVLWPK